MISFCVPGRGQINLTSAWSGFYLQFLQMYAGSYQCGGAAAEPGLRNCLCRTFVILLSSPYCYRWTFSLSHLSMILKKVFPYRGQPRTYKRLRSYPGLFFQLVASSGYSGGGREERHLWSRQRWCFRRGNDQSGTLRFSIRPRFVLPLTPTLRDLWATLPASHQPWRDRCVASLLWN